MTIKDFPVELAKIKGGSGLATVPYISWHNLLEVMGPEEYDRFDAWMRGQTCLMEGAYPWDVQQYLTQGREGAPIHD